MQSLKVRITVIKKRINKKLFFVFALFILIVLFANNFHAVIPELFGIESWYARPPWYEVDDWETDVCSKWGGTSFAGQAAVTTGRKLSWADMTATVQAKKFKSKEKYFIYEVGWYLDSFGKKLSYDIKLINEARPDLFYLVDEGSLLPESGKTGFEVYNLTDDYDAVRFTYTGGAVTVPVIWVK